MISDTSKRPAGSSAGLALEPRGTETETIEHEQTNGDRHTFGGRHL